MHLYTLSIKNSLQAMELKMNFPTILTVKGVGEGIQFLWLGVLFGSI